MNTERHKALTRELAKAYELHHVALNHLASQLMALDAQVQAMKLSLTPPAPENLTPGPS